VVVELEVDELVVEAVAVVDVVEVELEVEVDELVEAVVVVAPAVYVISTSTSDTYWENEASSNATRTSRLAS